MLLDEEGRRLYNIGSHGFDQERVGAEVEVGDGLIGAVAERCAPMRVGNLRQMAKYSRSVRRQFEDDQRLPAGADVPLPELTRAESRLAVPAMARGELVGVLTVDSALPVAFSEADQHVLGIVACTLASAIEHLRRVDEDDPPPVAVPARHPPDGSSAETTTVRFFPVDGSTFLGNDYLIKGVAGRILWALLRRHVADHRTEFSSKELRLDPTLELPGFKDNLESRLILLKRRLDEREAPVRIERIARGRFRLQVETAIRLHAEGS
jgi:adenylate cyclase